MALSLIFRSLHTGDNDHEFAIRYFHTFSVIGDMALGGLFAYLVSYENKFKSFIINVSKPGIVLLYAATLVITLYKHVLFPPGWPVIFERIVIAFLFGMIILEQNYAKHSLFKMSNFKIVSKLGIYTYGLYCLHFLGLYFAIKVMNALRLNGSITWVSFTMMLLALGLSVIISLTSYNLFEKWFLRWKDKFAFIVKK
jgi:peptidoglycan/LPS O-acetylase OafA/YrhL